ncbi:MAG TPA: ABC transporter substrate-binding protein [Acidimicrobiales bacterium]|nr:ABC transporter substrate-binding protein [Acidimicrobiales bacterium]
MVLALTAVVLLASCTGGDGDDTARPVPGARTGGTLTVGIGRPASIDPLDAYEPSGLLVARTMCDTLVELDPRTHRLRPGLAASWNVLDGGRQVSFRLRGSARFSDGSKVTAADVAFSLTRAASPSFAGRQAALLSAVSGWDDLQDEVGAPGKRSRLRLGGVRVVGAGAVEIAFSRPVGDAVALFTHPVTAPVSRAATERDPDGAGRRPVCAGPYRLTRAWSPADGTITLQRVNGYRGRPVYADRIEFRIGARSADVVVPTDVTATPAPGATRVSGPGPGVEYLALPTGTASPYRDRRVRRALDLATDRAVLVERTTPGRRAPARGFLPATIDGRACPEEVAAAADPEQARRLLRAAGIEPSGLPVRITVNDDGPNRAVADELARQWHDHLGLAVTVEVVAFDDLLARATGAAGIDGPVRVSWAAPYASADAHLAPLFAGGATTEANLGRWDDPEWDRLLDEDARTATDETDRVALYRRLALRLCDRLPSLPLTTSLAIADVRPDRVASTTGEWLDPLTGTPDLRRIWVRGGGSSP